MHSALAFAPSDLNFAAPMEITWLRLWYIWTHYCKEWQTYQIFICFFSGYFQKQTTNTIFYYQSHWLWIDLWRFLVSVYIAFADHMWLIGWTRFLKTLSELEKNLGHPHFLFFIQILQCPKPVTPGYFHRFKFFCPWSYTIRILW